MQPRTMFTTSLKIFCMLLCAPHQLICVSWKRFKTDGEYADKMCSPSFVAHALVVSNLLQCLGTCSAAPQCRATIFHKHKKTCYSLKKGYEGDGWSAKLAGAKMYIKDKCPMGWTFVDSACYRKTKGKHPRDNMATVCKALDVNAKLAHTISSMSPVLDWMVQVFLAEYDRLGFYNVWADHSFPGSSYVIYTIVRLHPDKNSFLLSRGSNVGPYQGLCQLEVH